GRGPRPGRLSRRSHRQGSARGRGLGAPRRRHQLSARSKGPPDHRRAPQGHREPGRLPGPLILRTLGGRHRETPRREGRSHRRGDRREGGRDRAPLGRAV
ncbi:Nitrile hydratase beta subunit, partial [uncultured Rubrobacteraceae bacterium]